MIDIDFRTYLCLGGYSHKSKHKHKRTRRTRRTRRTCCSAEIPMSCSPRARPLWPVVSWCQALRFPFRFPPRLGPHGVECRSHGTVAISCPEFSAGQSRLRQLTAGLNDLFFRKRVADAGYNQHFFPTKWLDQNLSTWGSNLWNRCSVQRKRPTAFELPQQLCMAQAQFEKLSDMSSICLQEGQKTGALNVELMQWGSLLTTHDKKIYPCRTGHSTRVARFSSGQ